jgi:hypothetical protein
MDILIKDSKFYIDQIVYEHIEENIYVPWRVRFIRFGKGNKITDIGVKHISVTNSGEETSWKDGRFGTFYAHNGELDNLVLTFPTGSKFI